MRQWNRLGPPSTMNESPPTKAGDEAIRQIAFTTQGWKGYINIPLLIRNIEEEAFQEGKKSCPSTSSGDETATA